MNRFAALTFAAGILAASPAAADSGQSEINGWLTQRHATLTQALNQALSPPPKVQNKSVARKAPAILPKAIRVSTKQMRTLPHSPRI